MARRTEPGAASEAPSESARERHNVASTEGVRAFRRWVQQAGVARYSMEMAAHYTELEISRFTSMLNARLSVLTDMEMVLYLALLLGPQVMAASLQDVLQQRAGTAVRVGQRFPPDLTYALPIRRPCALRPSSLRRSSPATAAVPSHSAHEVPSRGAILSRSSPVTPAMPRVRTAYHGGPHADVLITKAREAFCCCLFLGLLFRYRWRIGNGPLDIVRSGTDRCRQLNTGSWQCPPCPVPSPPCCCMCVSVCWGSL